LNATNAIKGTLRLIEIFECRAFDGGVIIVGHHRRRNDPDGIQAIMEKSIYARGKSGGSNQQVRYTTYGYGV
jgi:hypothetical protein